MTCLNQIIEEDDEINDYLDCHQFYQEYYGHPINQLEKLHDFIRCNKNVNNSIIWLVGDSSLDNKYWFNQSTKALNGYEKILDKPSSKKDIAYWLNSEIIKNDWKDNMTAINCAVEESSIGSRSCGRLLEHDKFVRNHIQEQDFLVVSVGGNDIALKPSICTIINTLLLLKCSTDNCIKNYSCGCSIPCDDYCYGSGPSCLSNLLAFPLGYGYFLHLFGQRIQSFIKNMLSGMVKPKKILICMIYYIDEKEGNGWADGVLATLGYNKNPKTLQSLIRSAFRDATKKLSLPYADTEIVAVPLFAALDGKTSSDYEQRVEPSAKGGNKMAKLIFDAIKGGNDAMDKCFNNENENITMTIER
jgi:hypothetical protein